MRVHFAGCLPLLWVCKARTVVRSRRLGGASAGGSDSLAPKLGVLACLEGVDWGAQIGNPKKVEKIQQDCKHPGRYIPTIFLLRSWGSLLRSWDSPYIPFIVSAKR